MSTPISSSSSSPIVGGPAVGSPASSPAVSSSSGPYTIDHVGSPKTAGGITTYTMKATLSNGKQVTITHRCKKDNMPNDKLETIAKTMILAAEMLGLGEKKDIQSIKRDAQGFFTRHDSSGKTIKGKHSAEKITLSQTWEKLETKAKDPTKMAAKAPQLAKIQSIANNLGITKEKLIEEEKKLAGKPAAPTPSAATTSVATTTPSESEIP